MKRFWYHNVSIARRITICKSFQPFYVTDLGPSQPSLLERGFLRDFERFGVKCLKWEQLTRSSSLQHENIYLQVEKRFLVLASAPWVMLTAVFSTGAAGKIVVLTDSSADPGHTLSSLAIWVSARIRGHWAPRACKGAGGGAQLGAKLRSTLPDSTFVVELSCGRMGKSVRASPRNSLIMWQS